MKKHVTEFIGTFFLVLTVGLTLTSGTQFAPLAIGSALMVMVYMGGHISGAHYNPAVSLAVHLRGKMSAGEMVSYWIAQLLGALVAALMATWAAGQTFAPIPGPDAGAALVVTLEFLFTFALALVFLNTATSPHTEGNSYYGLAIGFTVMTGAFAAGGISGGVFNPAVGVGPILVDAIHGGSSLGHLWMYLVGPLLGGGLAAVVFKHQHAAEPA